MNYHSPEFYNDVTQELLEGTNDQNVKRQRNISHLVTRSTRRKMLVAQLQAKQERKSGVDLKRFRLVKILSIVFRHNAANRFEYHTIW